MNKEFEKKVRFLKVFSSRTFKFIAAHYLQTTLKEPVIKSLHRELNHETKKILELFKGITREKILRKAGGKRLKEKDPEKFRDKFSKIQNELLKKAAFNKQYIENYKEAVIAGSPGIIAALDLIENLYPHVYAKLHEEYIKRNAENLTKQRKLFTIKQVLSLLKFIKQDEPPASLSYLKDTRPVRKTKNNRRQTIYKWIQEGKLRAVKVTIKNKKRWVIERSDLHKFSMKQSLEDAIRQLQKHSQGFCFRYNFLTEEEIMVEDVFFEPKVPQERVHILKLPIREMLELIKEYPHGFGMEKELRERFSNFNPPFAVEVGHDDRKNLEWIEKEKISEAVVRGAIGRKWIGFESRTDWIGELQIYLCEKVIPFLPLLMIKTVEDLKKYLRMSAHHELAKRLRESSNNKLIEFKDWEEELNDFEQ